jgi:hypothetical protein
VEGKPANRVDFARKLVVIKEELGDQETGLAVNG